MSVFIFLNKQQKPRGPFWGQNRELSLVPDCGAAGGNSSQGTGWRHTLHRSQVRGVKANPGGSESWNFKNSHRKKSHHSARSHGSYACALCSCSPGNGPLCSGSHQADPRPTACAKGLHSSQARKDRVARKSAPTAGHQKGVLMLLQRIGGQLGARVGLPGGSQGGEEPVWPGAVADQLSVL